MFVCIEATRGTNNFKKNIIMYTIETENNIYEVVNWQRKDYLYNVYIHKTSKLSGTYLGEANYSIGVKEPIMNLERLDVTILTYKINN